MSASRTTRKLPPPKAESELLAWLLDVLRPMNRTRVKQILRSGRVMVNGTSVTRHDHPLRVGDQVGIWPEAAAHPTAENHGLTIAFEDDSLVVIDKQAGLLTVATDSEKTDTAFARLRALLASRGSGRPYVVHRLDRETSGLLIFALRPDIRDRLQASWGSVTKTYLAVVEGIPKVRSGFVENFLTEGRDLRVRACNRASAGAKLAVTRYRVVGAGGGFSLVEVVLETGRKHQIRVHMSGLGCPIIGDDAYESLTNPAGRLGLHAWRLSFEHPVSGRPVVIESPLPLALRKVVGESH